MKQLKFSFGDEQLIFNVESNSTMETVLSQLHNTRLMDIDEVFYFQNSENNFTRIEFSEFKLLVADFVDRYSSSIIIVPSRLNSRSPSPSQNGCKIRKSPSFTTDFNRFSSILTTSMESPRPRNRVDLVSLGGETE